MTYEMLVGLPPFYSRDCNEMYQRILHDKLRFPPHVSENARSLVAGVSTLLLSPLTLDSPLSLSPFVQLLERDPSRRLGSGPEDGLEIKRHIFFKDIDWAALDRKEFEPPFDPKVVRGKKKKRPSTLIISLFVSSDGLS